MLDFEFSLKPPVDFRLTFAAAAAYQASGKTYGEGTSPRYRRPLRIGDATALIEMSGAGTIEAPTIRARVLASNQPVSEAAAGEKIAWMIDPAFDPAPFYALAATDPVLHGTIAAMRGLRLLRFTSVFEALIVTIIEQQIALRAAQKAEIWLAQTYGDCIKYQGEHYFAYPTPERLSELEVADLAPLKITFIRVGRMLDIARRQASGELQLEKLPTQGAEAMYAALMALPGVGHWTAAWAMIRSLGHFLYVGGADVALRSAINHYYNGVKGRIEIPEMDAVFRRYGEYDGLACFYTLMRWAFDKLAFEAR